MLPASRYAQPAVNQPHRYFLEGKQSLPERFGWNIVEGLECVQDDRVATFPLFFDAVILIAKTKLTLTVDSIYISHWTALKTCLGMAAGRALMVSSRYHALHDNSVQTRCQWAISPPGEAVESTKCPRKREAEERMH